MLRKKALNKIFLTTVIFFLVLVLYRLKIISYEQVENKIQEHYNSENVYTLNEDNYISKAEVYINKRLSLKDKIKEKLEIIIKENNKNYLLPSYFKPILPENTKVLDVTIENSVVKVYFSKELNNINEVQAEKMIEAITYTITDENILGIEIYVENKLLKYVPHTKKELPTILNKDFGINKSYEIVSTNDIVKIVMTYYSNTDEKRYEIPVTKYVNDEREKLEIIIDDLSKSSSDNLVSLFDGVRLIDYKIDNNSITINLNKDIDEEELELLIRSIENNYDISKIIILVNNQKKCEKTIEK